MAAHLVADGDDAAGHLVAGHTRLGAGDIAPAFLQDVRADAGEDVVLARMVGELLQELHVREAQAHRLHFHQYLVRAGSRDFLVRVQDQLARSDQLHGILGSRHGFTLGHMIGHLSQSMQHHLAAGHR